MRPPELGDVVDRRYRLERLVAEGGAGLVFAATQLVSGRQVALKVPLPQWRRNTQVTERLLREARALTLARHRNVVELLDAGTADDRGPYLALELLEGRSLHGLLAARQRLTVLEAVAIGCQLCDALAACHERGVVHRDVKPANLFVAVDERREERLKLLDFGVAAFLGEAAAASEIRLSLPGAVLGTAEYMAPEQLLGSADLDARCDVYGAAATLYECLGGKAPFEGAFGQILLAATSRGAPPLATHCPTAPEELGAVLGRAMERDRDARFPSASALKSALCQAVGRPEPPVVRFWSSGPTPQTTPHPRAPSVTSPPSLTIPASVEDPRASAEQRRRFPRAPYVTPVTLRRAGGATVYGRSQDVSEAGLLVLTAELCQAGERVRVRFAPPGTGQFVELAADARWVRAGRDLGVAGFELIDPPESLRTVIRAYVARFRT
ncbi:MAG: protein kinase [Polyangiaceae bacterium]|nr:protein kinase [Polyangiaceae bacterium]